MAETPDVTPSERKRAWRDRLKRRLADRVTSAEEAEALASRFMNGCPNAKCILLYASTPSEAPTDRLMQRLWQAGVRVALPVIQEGDSSFMDAFAVEDETHFVADRFGIPAPGPECRTDAYRIAPEQLDAVAVPGLGFDPDTGVRLGRSGGYYDRFLARCPNALRIGLAFDEQVVHGLPAEPHDVPMHAIVTPTRTLLYA